MIKIIILICSLLIGCVTTDPIMEKAIRYQYGIYAKKLTEASQRFITLDTSKGLIAIRLTKIQALQKRRNYIYIDCIERRYIIKYESSSKAFDVFYKIQLKIEELYGQ